MGLETRKGRNGKTLNNWYGSYTDENGKRRVIPLREPLPLNRPTSLKLRGSKEFEASRERALLELRMFQGEARQKGRTQNLIKKLIEIKTDSQWKEIQIKDLTNIEIKGRRAKERAEWLKVVIKRFVSWCKEEKIESIFDVTLEKATEYISSLSVANDQRKAYATSTVRQHKSILSMLFRQVLPHGANNPFTGIRIHTEDGQETIHRKPLTPDQLEILLKSTQDDPFVYPLIVTAVCTGLRRGDICRLKWCDVDMRNQSLSIKTRKTGAKVMIPILPLLMTVLKSQLAEKRDSDIYVYPDPAKMMNENPSGISYRIKKAFVTAFKSLEIPPLSHPEPVETTPLCDVLEPVLEALETAPMNDTKKAKIKLILKLYASGESYRKIEKTTKVSRGQISDYLHEVQRISRVNFLKDRTNDVSQKQLVKKITRVSRGNNMRDASVYDMHALRTTFVTLAIGGGLSAEKVIAITGHSTVRTAMSYYFKPRGTDFRKELMSALPSCLTET